MFAAEDFGDAEVGDFEMAVVGHEEIFEFDVAVGDAVGVKVADAAEELFPEAEVVLQRHVAFLHEGVELALGTVFHDDVPAAGVGAETDAFDDVGVV